MGIAIIILGAFIVLLVVVIYKQGRKLEAKEHQIEAIKAEIERQKFLFHGIAESRPAKGKLKELCQELSQSKVTKSLDKVWSEEDEKLLNGFIKEVESELKRPNLKGDDLILNKKISWLKSLKERFKQAMEE